MAYSEIAQISKELKQYHHVERLEDVRVIRDRQTSKVRPQLQLIGELANSTLEASRGFGFIRFPSLEDSKAFVERNYPMIYLYGNGSTDNDDQAAKVRIAYSRERDDRGRGDKADGEWTCKIVRKSLDILMALLRPLVHICQLSRPNQMSQMSDTADRYVSNDCNAGILTDDH